tara:strand:+ start:6666 stop:7313 length:648 start_codon:yes stop_codon:yes gene_type:complete
MSYRDISKIRVCKVLEDNYNTILKEYQNFKFDIDLDNVNSDCNWKLWKSVHEASLAMAKTRDDDIDWENVSFEPYKKSHSWYGLIVNHLNVWEGALVATKTKFDLSSLPELEPTPICDKFFNNTLNILKEYEEITSIMIAKFPAGKELPIHRGYKEILRIHLGLIVPDGDIGFCVNGEKTKWENGKCLAFNDFFEHSAWNHTNQDRINLIVDVKR